jgi:hypothetical protein
MMYEAVRGALAADDALKEQGEGAKFRVRETSEWKMHAAELEGECSKGAVIRGHRLDGRSGAIVG